MLNTENVLQRINAKYITLDTDEVRHNNGLLKETLDRMILKMKEIDPLFVTLYQRCYYGGSFYDDLKVGKPDEFDLDLLLTLPKTCETHRSKDCGCVEMFPSNKPGFFWFKANFWFYSRLNRFIVDGYVQTNLVLEWLQSLVTIALNSFDSVNFSFPTVPKYHSQSGPALTLRLLGNFGWVDVDLVPAFQFGADFWPEQGYKANPTEKFDFFIAPKKAKGISKFAERYWRASFQDQEKVLINDKQRLKPALRLLKKMRNNLGHFSISSYALKTIVLCEADSFDWNNSLSEVFLKMLKNYRDYLKNGKILYYWNKKYNLLEGVHSDTLTNHCNEITRKIKKFEENMESNPLEIAKIILKEGTEEYNLFISDYEFEVHDGRLDTEQIVPEHDAILGWTIGLGAAVILGTELYRYFSRNNNNSNR